VYNFAINNEAIQVARPVPLLTKNTNIRGIRAMADHKHSKIRHSNQPNFIKVKVGDRYNRLTILEEVDPYRFPSGKAKRTFLCECDCGNQIETTLNSLRSGNTKSCGCYNREMMDERRCSHNKSHHPLYQVFCGMVARCENKNHKSYSYYGARDITICDEWRYDFDAFYEWALDNGWKKGLQIDRIDNYGGYSPENCRVVKPEVNARNRRLLLRNNTSGFRGARKTKYGTWEAWITYKRKRYFLGTYASPEEAAKAYDNKVLEFNSEHPLNFPEGE
jgi:hypothetical protein